MFLRTRVASWHGITESGLVLQCGAATASQTSTRRTHTLSLSGGCDAGPSGDGGEMWLVYRSVGRQQPVAGALEECCSQPSVECNSDIGILPSPGLLFKNTVPVRSPGQTNAVRAF
ncbi:hypothetical protein P280DRAFT_469477 [Massarina eburnea CBS 473.64]|uniref:Uncharacterized protein n=1 Tax=Massarina eburnea CBS 473.64 TaxID=1395130 RepID=A0A6A6RZV0_9PLEO|nr:hypothetical protein P280DRAFT_469477 [Massarina eburnea CBS 473.64]